MATINQIYSIVNDSARQALGEQAINAIDVSTFISLGDQVFSSNTNRDLFYSALTDRIGRTVIAVRQYASDRRAIKRDEMDWGIIYQKINYKLGVAKENPTWQDPQKNPFDVEGSIEVDQKLFSKVGTWSHEEVIRDVQMRTAFTNPATMAQFISGLFIAMQNSMELEDERITALACNSYMAVALNSNNDNVKRNLLAEYNTGRETPLTVANCLSDLGFLKYATQQINLTLKRMKRYSTIFNPEKWERFTPSDRAVVEIHADFDSATATYLQADTYHDELVKLTGSYETVPYWQGSGTTFAFADTSKIHVTLSDTVTVEQGGIIAFVHDIDAVASVIYNRRSNSIYNPRSECTNYFEKADTGYAVDPSENGVVFYIAD